MEKQVEIDVSKGVIVLPRVCEIYKHDFGGDPNAILRFCETFLDSHMLAAIRARSQDESTIRFRPSSEHYYPLLKLLQSS